ncbi:hypothetical protein LZ32DRAFT_553711 [Colletotrichum eremochloae]|nr:hypothetical protein LZ32DRAFT_553711 [Colletotrichum eremochloae]
MMAPASASSGAAPSNTTFKKWAQQPQQQQDEEQLSAGAKNVFNRVLNRRLSLYSINKKSTPVYHQQAEPTPPPSRQQRQQQQQPPPPTPPMPMPMQPSIRHRPQLHNPQNTLRATSTPVDNIQNQGHIDNGHAVAPPLPGLDENMQLQLPPTTWRSSSTAVGATDAALANSTPLSSSAAPPAREETGLFARLMRRRPAPKEGVTENHKKRGNSAGSGDNTSQPSGVDDRTKSLTEPVSVISETTEHRPMQTQSLRPNTSHKTHDAQSNTPKSEIASNAQTTPKSSSVPRFLRQVTNPRQASEAMIQTAATKKSKSHSHLRPSQLPEPSSTTQPKLQSKRSFGKRFWSRPGANDFGEDDAHVANTEAPPVPRTVYVPKHAAADFSRTTIKPLLNRQSLVIGHGQVNAVRTPATTSADTRVGEPETQQRQQTLAVATGDKRLSRDQSKSKYEAPSPMELHRRLEIIKRSEVEVVTTLEPATLDPWPHQLNLLHSNSNTSASNIKAPAPVLKSHSRSLSSRRHSFSLVSDPHARELTPPKTASSVEKEEPFDPPSRMPQQMDSAVPPRPMSSYDYTYQKRQDSPVKQHAAREMTDFERFLAKAEATERERQAQMWRNLARVSGHYGYSDNPWSPFRPVDPSLTGTGIVNKTTDRSNKRSSAQYTVNKRTSMMSGFYEPAPGASGSRSDDADATRGPQRQGSVSKRISSYIKPPKPSDQPVYENWPTGRVNRRSVIVGAIGE